jgi:hypothetical protein
LASIYLAQYYCDIRSFEDANKHADIAEKKARLPKDKAAVFLVRANIIETSANKAAAAIYLKGKLPEIDSDKEKCELLVQIAKISDDPEAMVAYEHCLRLDPEAKNVRFSLALLYAKQKPLKFLAIRHYQALLRQDRLHSGASNNLALLYGEMDVASEEVRLLRQAAERDDGHATGNLALIYLRAGFTADAEKVLDSANPILATSERISAARQEIHRNSEAAKEKITELTAQSENLASAFAKFNFEELVATSNYVGRWVSDNETEGLEISARSLTVKIVHSSGQDKRYINSFGLSPITVAKASKDENLSNTLMSIMSGTDVVLLVGPAKIRVLDFDGSVLKKQIDFHRSAG